MGPKLVLSNVPFGRVWADASEKAKRQTKDETNVLTFLVRFIAKITFSDIPSSACLPRRVGPMNFCLQVNSVSAPYKTLRAGCKKC